MSTLVTETIGERSPSIVTPRRRATSVAAAPMSWRQRQQFDVLGAGGAQCLDCQHALGMSGDRDGRSRGEIHSLAGQCAHRGDLGEQNTGQRARRRHQLPGARHRLLGGQSAHPPQRIEPDRADDDQFPGDRLQHHFGRGEQCRQLILDAT